MYFPNFLFNCLLLFCLLTSNLHAEQPLKMAVTGLAGLEELERDFGPFQEKLNQLSQLQIKFYPISSRTIVIQALKAKSVDLVLFGPAEYVIATSMTKITPIAGLLRGDYFSSLIVLSVSGINSINDLRGKKVGVGEFGSTSYHLSPIQMIAKQGLDPLVDIQLINIAKQVSWEALKRKDLAAIGLKHDQYESFLSKETIADQNKFKVLASGPELPNDLLVAGGHVPDAICQKLINTFANHSDELINSVVEGIGNDKYKGMRFITNIKDQDYQPVREMFTTVGYPEFSKRYDDK